MKNKSLKFYLIGLLLVATTVFAAKFSENILIIGKGFIAEETRIVSNQPGNSDPYIGFDPVQEKWVFTEDGVLIKKFGTGSGNGSGGINELENPGFEDGIDESWTNTGGTVTELNTAADLGFGEKSARFTATAAAEYYESANTAFSNIVADGFGCAADFNYKSGANFTVKIFKEDLPGSPGSFIEVASETLLDQTSWAKFPTLRFPCSESMKIRFESTAAGSIDLDQIYLGSNKGIIEVDNVLTFSGVVDNTGSGAIIVSQSAPFIQSVARTSAGRVTVTFIPGFFTVAPAVTVGCFEAACTDHQANTNNVTTAGFNVITESSNIGTDFDLDFSFIVQKQGVDASDKIAVTPDQASFFIDATVGGAVVALGATGVPTMPSNSALSMSLKQGSAFIACTGSEVASGLTCSGTEGMGISFVAPVAGDYEVCMAWSESSSGANRSASRIARTENNSQTILELGQATSASTNPNINPVNICDVFEINSPGQVTFRVMNVTVAGTGFELDPASAVNYNSELAIKVKLERNFVAQPIILNQVTSSLDAGIKTVACTIDATSGTPLTLPDTGLCGSWVDSISDLAPGQHTINIKAGTFSQTPACVANPLTSANHACRMQPTVSTSQATMICVDGGFTNTDTVFTLICQGAR